MIVCSNQKVRPLASIGPRSFNRGNSRNFTPVSCPVRASIGPRSFNRGNLKPKLQNTVSYPLQLGRDLSTAETGSLACHGGPVGWLQLGRGLSTAETSLDCVDAGKSVLASIGPRSFNRGNVNYTGVRFEDGQWLQLGRGLSTAET